MKILRRYFESEENKSSILDKCLLVLIIPVAMLFLLNLYKIAHLIKYFPISSNRFFGDAASYMARVFFLDNYGFHSFVPYWYNGIISFLNYPPGWFFFTLPIYKVVKNIPLSFFISLIIIYILIFIFLLILGNRNKFSKIKSTALFLFVFMSPPAILEFMQRGRITSFFGFMLFLGGFLLILEYKNKKIDKKFMLGLIVAFSLLTLAHPAFLLLFSFPTLGLILIKRNVERIKILSGVLVSAILTSFWWFPFLFSSSEGGLIRLRVIDTIRFLSYDTIIIVMFLLSFYLYWNYVHKNRKELLFYLPLLLLSVLYLTKLVGFIPGLYYINPNSYKLVYLFLAFFLIFKIKFKERKIKTFLFFGLGGVALFLLSGVLFYQPAILEEKLSFFTPIHSEIDREAISVLPLVDGKLLIVPPTTKMETKDGPRDIPYWRALYSYGSIFNNISTPAGWGPETTTIQYMDKLTELYSYLEVINDENCIKIDEWLEYFNVDYILTYYSYCDDFCGYEQKAVGKYVCLLQVE